MGCRNQFKHHVQTGNRKQVCSAETYIEVHTLGMICTIFLKYFCLHRRLSYTNSKASNMSYINNIYNIYIIYNIYNIYNIKCHV